MKYSETMEMSRSLFLIAFLCLSLPAEHYAATSTVEGVALGREGHEFYLLRYHDHFSKRWFVEDQVTIGDDGVFEVEATIDHIELVTLVSGGWQEDIYIRPNDKVQVELRVPQGAVARRFNDNRLELFIKSAPEDNPNLVLSDFSRRSLEMIGESTYDLAQYFGAGSSGFRSMNKKELLKTNMITETGDSLQLDDKQTLIDSVNSRFVRLKTKLLNQRSGQRDTSVQHLLTAAMGILDLSLGRSPQEVYEEYLPRNGCQWWNPESVRLYETVHSLLPGHPEVNDALLFNAVKSGDLAKARDELVDYPFYDRPKGRDALILLVSRNLWHEDRMYHNGVMRILTSLAGEDKLGEVAGNLKQEIKEGTLFSEEFMPDVTLLDHRLERVKLNSFDQQFVFLSLVMLQGAASQRELLLMEGLHRKYRHQVTFVTIVMDEGPNVLQNYLAEHPEQDWTFLKAGGDPRLQRSFDLRSVPAFYLIRPDNRLYSAYTSSPSEGAERLLSEVTKGNTREFNPWRDRQ